MASIGIRTSNLQVPFKLLGKVDSKELIDAISASAADVINTRVINQTGFQNQIINIVKDILSQVFYKSSTVQSIVDSDQHGLRSQFGLTYDIAHKAINEIIKWLQDKVEVKFGGFKAVKKIGANARMEFDIRFLPQSLAPLANDVLSGRYISAPSQEIVPWLQWLTQAGDAPVVPGYRIAFASELHSVRTSRSELSLMLKSQSTVFTVPPEHSGTLSNNFITRAFEKVPQLIENKVVEEITREFSS